MPIYGPWIQGDDVQVQPRIDLAALAVTYVVPDATTQTWADFLTAVDVTADPTITYDTAGLADLASHVGYRNNALPDVPEDANWFYEAVLLHPTGGFDNPDSAVVAGPDGSPPSGAVSWESHPDDGDGVLSGDYTAALTYSVEGRSQAEFEAPTLPDSWDAFTATVRVIPTDWYTVTTSTWDVTSYHVPGLGEWDDGDILASTTVTPDLTSYTAGNSDTAAVTLPGGTVGVYASLDGLEGTSPRAASTTGPVRLEVYDAFASLDLRQTLTPPRYRWIYEGVTTPPLLARSVSRADAGGTPPLLARGRNSRQERLTARGPL
jgi:hypothetical protein